MRYVNLFDFWFDKFSSKYSTWDWDQIGIKLGTEHIIYEKLINFMYKEYPCLACNYRTKQNAKEGLNFEGLEMQK